MAASPQSTWPAATVASSLILAALGCSLAPRIVEIQGSGMDPSYPEGTKFQVVEVDPQDLARGDILIFQFPLDPERNFIKRLIGLPGETVELTTDGVFIDGVALVEEYEFVPDQYTMDAYRLGADEYFVLGDNRPESSDSRHWGPVKWPAIIGKAIPLQ